MQNLRKQTYSGITWNFANQITVKAINLVITLVLMRLLSPQDFGILAAVLVGYNFFSIFNGFNISEAIIQQTNVNQIQLSSSFWASIINATIILSLFVLMSPVIAAYYGNSILLYIIPLLAIDFLLNAASSIHLTLLRKKMNFKRLFQIQLISLFISSSIAICAALMSFGVWSLIFKIVINSFVVLITVWIVEKWRPDLVLVRKQLVSLLNFSIPLTGNRILQFFSRNTDDLLIGKFIGMYHLGIYSRAYNLMQFPQSSVSSVITSVLFPALSSIQDDIGRIKKIFLKSIRLIGFITFPMMMLLFVVTEEFITVFLGESWFFMKYTLKIFAILGMFQSIGSISGLIFISLGETSKLFRIGLITNLIVLSFILVGVFYFNTIEGVAFAYALASILLFFPVFKIMGNLIETTVWEIAKNIAPYFLGAVLMGIIVSLQNQIIFDSSSDLLVLILSVVSGIGYFILIITLFHRQTIKEIIDLGRDIRHQFNKS